VRRVQREVDTKTLTAFDLRAAVEKRWQEKREAARKTIDTLIGLKVKYSFVIPCKLPSNNALSGHRWAKTNWTKLYLKELVPLTKANRWKGPAHLTITRGIGARERFYDVDNAYGGCKPLIDALKLAGYIEDDSHDLLTLAVFQMKSEGGSYVEVSIE
jgi:hypothetical protein